MYPTSTKPTPERLISDDMPKPCAVRGCTGRPYETRLCDKCMGEFRLAPAGVTYDFWLAAKNARPSQGFSGHVEEAVVTLEIAEAARAMGYDARVGDPIGKTPPRLHTGETLRAAPGMGSRWTNEKAFGGTYAVEHVSVMVEGGQWRTTVRLRSVDVAGVDATQRDWPGEWVPAPCTNGDGLKEIDAARWAEKRALIDPAFGSDYTGLHTYANPGAVKPIAYADIVSHSHEIREAARNILHGVIDTSKVPTYTRAMARTRLAFFHVAEAMLTPRGRRMLAVHEVEEAVCACPAGLVPEAYGVTLMWLAEGRDRALVSSPRFIAEQLLRWLRSTPKQRHDDFGEMYGTGPAYERALAALRAPRMSRPGRWSGGDNRGATPRTEGVARRFLPSESAETRGERWGR